MFRADRYERLRALIWGARVEADVDEEFEAHIAMRAEAYVAAGMSAEQARAEALRRFGDKGSFQRETRAIDHSTLREQKRMELFDALLRELKQAARGLARSPGFTLVAALTLALGIGASTAVYTLLDAVVLNPLPYPNADRLVRIDHAVPAMGAGVHWPVATASYFHYGEGARSFDGYGAYWIIEQNVRGRAEAFRGSTAQVTANLLPLMGARPVVGRFFRAEEDVPNAPLVAVLSYELWQNEYSADPAVVGQTVEINGAAVGIIGVAQKGFKLPDRSVDVWYARRIALSMQHVNWHHLDMIARLKPGVSQATAQAELMTLGRGLHDRFPNVYDKDVGREDGFHPRLRGLRESIVGDVSKILWILLGSVSVVLLVACANVANLFLVRAETRRSELAVRTALGAERTHLALQSLTETLLLTTLAAGLGIWFAYGGLRLLVALAPASLPRLSEVHLSGATILFALAVGTSAGLVFGLFPLLRRHTDFKPLREIGRGMTTTRTQLRIRSVLVTAQIALALMLLAAGGLMLRSYQRMNTMKTGIDARNVLALDVSIPFMRYDSYQKAATFWRELTRQLSALPGVQQVGGAAELPFAMARGSCSTLWVDPAAAEGNVPGCLGMTTQLPGYFEALRIPVRGRTTTWTDIETGTGAIVITRVLAERLWPGQDALGKGIRGQGPGTVYFRVVGVADDFRGQGFREPASQIVFFPPVPAPGTQLWGVSTALNLVIKSGGEATQLTPAVRRVIHEMDRSAAIGSVQTMEAVVAESMNTTSFTMLLLSIAGVMALLLSVVGLYGVVSYVVSRRRTEIGIRMALGAPATEVGRMVVMQSMRLGAVGVAIGLMGAFFTTQTLRTLLFEVEPTDPLTLTIASSFLLATCALASYLPARRAARVSPVEALRS